MAEVLLSIALERLISVAEQQIRYEVDLVRGVDAEIHSLKLALRSLRGVLEDAERRQVNDSSVKEWLERLKDMAYQIDDVVDEWSSSLLQLQIENSASTSQKKASGCLLSPFSCLDRVACGRDIALKIQSIQKKLDDIDRDRNRFQFAPTRIEKPQHPITTSGIDISEVRGREMDEQAIIAHLLGENMSKQRLGPSIVSIIGVGGMGKTTLAQLAYKHPKVLASFDARIWVCVSDPFEPHRIFRHIVEDFTKQPCQLQNLEVLQQEVETFISGKKFLIVLDDVWTEDYGSWEQVRNSFSHGAIGSIILVTTRKESVVQVIRSNYQHQLGELSREQSCALFHQIAFYGKTPEEEETLKAIGEKIADKGKGLPLAIKTLGNLMRSKNSIEKWEAVMNNEVWELDVFQKDISPALWLSYYDLPSEIKRCFSFCAVFPKDYEFHRDELIRLWMAHNYLGCGDGSKEMEMVGKEYFEYLGAVSFFQDFKKDDDGDITQCKMHDIVHDFAQFLTKNECVVMESDKQRQRSIEKIRHATLIVQKDVKAIVSSLSMKNLHTLLLSCQDSSKFVPLSFQNLTCLQALKLEARGLEKLLDEVGKLLHLRYLDLSNCSSLRELPETICNLYNLQTLKVWGCINLKKLPQTMSKLSNLRHLENLFTNLESFPKGIARLSSLQTLDIFIVSNGGDAECKISDLKNLSKLRGSLKIQRLDKVEDAREAEEAQLEKMAHLQELSLLFNFKKNKAMADALKPPPKLEALMIAEYVDVDLPSWMTGLSLSQLKSLQLWELTECSCMPPLGELPVLEYLLISEVDSLKYVGDEFLGSSSTTTIAFPRLKELTFGDMKNWEKWEVKEEEERSVMPSLRALEMYKCPKLERLPNYLLHATTLQKLEILECPILKQHCEKNGHTSHIPTNR